MVGTTIDPMRHDVDERWTMAYAAALGDHDDCYMDTTSADGIVAHPLFAVCPEWPVIVSSRQLSTSFGLTADEVRQGVHATHDVVIRRLVRPGDTLHTRLSIAGLEQRNPGAFSTSLLETTDSAGEPVATTEQGSLYLGVPLDGDDRPPVTPLDPIDLPDLDGTVRAEIPVPISAGAAHTYTECARIWNPIHTDRTVALAAGLPDIILHGTATLALAVSQIVATEAEDRPELVRRIRGRFRSMVLMPSTITVRIVDRTSLGDGRDAVRFDVQTEQGGPAIDNGLVVLGPEES